MLLSRPYLVYSELISELGPPTMGNLSRVPAGKGGEWNSDREQPPLNLSPRHRNKVQFFK